MSTPTLTYDETMARLGCKRSKLNEFVQSGQLRSVKLGKARIFVASDVDAFLEAMVAEQTESKQREIARLMGRMQRRAS